MGVCFTKHVTFKESLSTCIHRALHIYLPIRQFFHDIIHPEYSPVCDVYALMFLIDVVNFIVIIFGYWAFGVSTDSHYSMG